MKKNNSKDVVDINEENEDILHGTACILVVDDETAIRNMTKDILTSHGYTVFCAASAKEALSLLEIEKINLVLSDVIMAEMDGFELAHIIHYTHPDIKIQLTSGYAESKGKSVTNKTLSEKLLAKPFTSKQLLIKIHDLLNN